MPLLGELIKIDFVERGPTHGNHQAPAVQMFLTDPVAPLRLLKKAIIRIGDTLGI